MSAPGSTAPPINDIIEMFAEAVAARVVERLAARQGEQKPTREREADFLSEIEVSRRTGLSRRTLQGWRGTGRGPPWVKVGRRCLYPAAELAEFLRARSASNVPRPQRRLRQPEE